MLGTGDASFPFSDLDDHGQPAGYVTDICMRIVDAVKTALQMPQ